MRVRISNVDVNEAVHHFVAAGFTARVLSSEDVSLLPRTATREELEKAVSATHKFHDAHKEAQCTVFSGGKGRPFHIPKLPSAF